MDIVSLSEETIQINFFLFNVRNTDSKMVWIMFRVENKDIRTMTTSTVSLVDFERVNVRWDVTRSLLNDFLIYF